MEVPTLQEFALLSLTDCLMNEKCPCRVMKMQWQNLIRQLDQGSWGDTSKYLLDRLVKFYGRKVTPIILEALLPINAKDLNLKKCPLVTEECLNKIMKRCNDLKTMNLKTNCHLKFDNLEVFNNNFKNSYKLTTVVLEGCPQVHDGNIKSLLKNAPSLVSLNVSRCNITDNAFLLNGDSSDFNNYECKLEEINLRFCEKISNTGVHHLCSLCGSTLQSVDLLKTKVDVTALLYLSGFGLNEAEQFLNSTRDVSDEECEQTEICFQAKITNLSLCDLVFQSENVGLLCFQQFLQSNRNVSCLRFYCFSQSESFITDNVLKLIGDHAQHLKSLMVVRGLQLTTSGIARLSQCKQLTNIELIDSDTIEDSAIIELVQKLNLSHIKVCFTSVSSASLNAIAAKKHARSGLIFIVLKELQITGCVELMDDTVGLHNVIRTSKSLEKLHMTHCCVSTTTLNLLAKNCHNITEILFASEDTDYSDESIILLSKNLRLLRKVYMGENSILTDQSIKALLTNCKRLTNLDLNGLKVTFEPFLQLITVPDDLKKYLTDEVNKKILSGKVNVEDFNMEIGLYGIPELKGSASCMQRFIQEQIILILDVMPGFQKNHTFFK